MIAVSFSLSFFLFAARKPFQSIPSGSSLCSHVPTVCLFVRFHSCCFAIKSDKINTKNKTKTKNKQTKTTTTTKKNNQTGCSQGNRRCKVFGSTLWEWRPDSGQALVVTSRLRHVKLGVWVQFMTPHAEESIIEPHQVASNVDQYWCQYGGCRCVSLAGILPPLGGLADFVYMRFV